MFFIGKGQVMVINHGKIKIALNNWLFDCDACSGTRKILGLGSIPKTCENCKIQCRLISCFVRLKRWIMSNPFKTTPVQLSIAAFFIMLIVTTLVHNHITLTLLTVSFGAIFPALKYRLDQSNYNKSLFDERYAIFIEIDMLLLDYPRFLDETLTDNNSWRDVKRKLDSIYRKSYFIFGKDTYQFIEKFRKSIITFHSLRKHTDDPKVKKEINEIKEFLNGLLDEQNLSKNFMELKIDHY